MKKILLFAGTSEGRRLSECLAGAEIGHTLCVATEYGEIVMKPDPLVEIRRGRMGEEEILDLLCREHFEVVIDATHPYAETVTRNIKEAVEGLQKEGRQITYLRLKRESEVSNSGSENEGCETVRQIRFFDTSKDCAKALTNTKGNILLTTGSKELSVFCSFEALKERLYVRVLPSMKSLSQCMENGICGKQIIAMQGPFHRAMNEALIVQYQIAVLVTKESGSFGGYTEKLEAAGKAGIPVFVIGRPREEEGISFSDTVKELEKLCGCSISGKGRMQIILAGVGMGGESGMTVEVREAIREADILLGAPRMLACALPGIEKRPFYRAEEVISCLKELQVNLYAGERRKIVVLLSGDSGFYSGCRKLYDTLREKIEEGSLYASLRVMPGISSVSYLSACTGESYEDAAVCSMHEKQLSNLAKRVRGQSKTFFLTSGVKDVNRLGEQLTEAGLTDCEVIVGYQMSYENERIECLTPARCLALREEGLYTCLVKNPRAEKGRLTHGFPDEAFIRGGVPMTKEEVRETAICKLRLWKDAVVYDIGSGTGSVTVEMAGLSDEIQVYAIERKPEAVSLIQQNREKYSLENIAVIEGQAPEALLGLPEATHAFIGGSGGRLKEIAETLYRINPHMRIVITAASLETICEIKEIWADFPVTGEELVQIQISKAKEAGSHHLMQAENPVWVCSFDFYGQ